MENNRHWALEQSSIISQPLLKNVMQQTPNTLWIGCSDSRVPPELITQKTLGELFVHRNIANQFKGCDLNINSVLEYAIVQLQVDHIVVCGHYRCGGVQAVLENTLKGVTEQWLDNLSILYKKNQNLFSNYSNKQTWDALCELNVIKQVYDLLSSPTYISASQNNHNLLVHSMIYDIRSGQLNDLMLSSSNGDHFHQQCQLSGYQYELS
ncbi:carbonic anhydrase [Vibrio cyclitrophicus]|nr:carbonic anhydrase [Vibrio cyclitrophicus]